MTRWFRFYEEVVNDPKVQRLPGEKFKAWVNLLCLASKNGGVLPPLDDVTFALRVTRDDCVTMLDEFCDAGLIDHVDVRGAPMSYEPHKWKERQYLSDTKDPTSAERSKRYRDKKRDASRSSRDGTVSVTATRTDTEQIQKKEPAIAAPDLEVDLYRRGKEVLGKTAGGLIKQLVEAKEGKLNLARAAIETAAGKENPREYIGGIIRNQTPPHGEAARYVDPRL